MKKLFILLAIFGMIRLANAQNADAFPVQLTIVNGQIEGNYDTRTNIQSYLGIPYAQPPVGELRWRAPRPIGDWQGVKETKKFGPRAVQPLVWDDMLFRSDGVSEDCLYLNVWTPAKRNTTGLPVLVYFYGGGFFAGDGSEKRYDGESMAQQGIVTVTVNYRLNIFGFLAHPELSAEAPYKASGNYGLLDQNAALKWVQNNIAAFGGDPKKVTIAGESAGSVSVSLQMASPLSKNLIAGAIGESGAGIPPTLPPIPLAEAEKVGEDFCKNAGYTSIAELRKLSTREIYELYEASNRLRFPLVIDNYFMPASLPEIFREGKQAQVPLLAGWNSAESRAGAFMRGQELTSENFIKTVQTAFPDAQTEILKQYPHDTPEAVLRSATNLASDRFISYSTWKWMDLHMQHSKQPVYQYFYKKLRPAPTGATAEQVAAAKAAVGAPHACEIEYAMGNLPLVDIWQWDENDYKVSKTMQLYFANFIKTGNPNGEELPQWDNHRAAENPVMIIDTESQQQPNSHNARFRALDHFYQKKS